VTSSLPFEQAAPKFCLPLASLSLLFLDLFENEILLWQQQNLLVSADWMTLFSSPA